MSAVSDPASLADWTPRPRPARTVLEGRYVRLEPLDADRHADGLYDQSAVADADARFTWLFEMPPTDRATFRQWVETVSRSEDPLFFAVIDQATGMVAGRQALMRIDPAHGVIEIGSIYWGPLVSRRPAATEALFLFADYAFRDLGYRRFEWKCHNANEPSKRAALRFGFTYEGLFRQHMVAKGKNRDTAWFSILDSEWPVLRQACLGWLSPDNFDAAGQQKQPLSAFR